MLKSPLDPRELGHYVALAQVGLEMVAPVVIGLLLDYYLDWHPWATIGGAIVGLVGGIGHLIALTNRRNREDSSKAERKDS